MTPTAASPTLAPRRTLADRARGSALIEALVAVVLMAFAGSVLAAAATTSLRASRRAAALERVTATAARELALAETRAAPVGTETVTLADLDPRAERRLDVTSDGDVATLDVQVAAPGTPPVRLTTRIPVVE